MAPLPHTGLTPLGPIDEDGLINSYENLDLFGNDALLNAPTNQAAITPLEQKKDSIKGKAIESKLGKYGRQSPTISRPISTIS